MRKNLLLLLISAFTLSSCSPSEIIPDGMIWDFVNPNVTFHVVDESGNNLLDSDFEGNLLTENTYVEYRGKKYSIDEDNYINIGPESQTKANMPLPFAIRIQQPYLTSHKVFHFGEFDPTRGYDNEKFTIFWADGSKDVINVSLSIEWKRHEPTIHSKLLINDKEAEKSIYGVNTLVKKPRK